MRNLAVWKKIRLKQYNGRAELRYNAASLNVLGCGERENGASGGPDSFLTTSPDNLI